MEAIEAIAAATDDAGPALKPTRPVRGFLFDLVVAVVLSVVLAAATFAAGAMLTRGGLPPQGRLGTSWHLLLSGIATGGAALVLHHWRRRPVPGEWRASLHAARSRATWGLAALVALVLFAASQALGGVAQALELPIDPANADIIKRALMTSPAFALLFAALIAPAYEELLFRRIFLGRFLAAGKPWLGVALSSALFALAHEIPGATGNSFAVTTVLWLFYAGMGAVLGWLYWRTGTLLAPIAAHGLHNLASCLLVLGTWG